MRNLSFSCPSLYYEGISYAFLIICLRRLILKKHRWSIAGRRCLALVLLATLLISGARVGRASSEDITFPQTGFTLSDAHGFLGYWQEHGGLAQFGYPISPEAVEVSPTNGRTY